MRIGGIVDMSTVDWYGNVSLVVFFAGCNFRCPYCQNSGLIHLDSGEEVGLGAIRKRIEANMEPVPQLDAVVFTGGEPLIQPEAALAAGRMVKELGLKLMLDTNGSISRAVEQLLEAEVIDRVALDIKAPLAPKDYKVVAGLSEDCESMVEGVITTLEICNNHGVEVEARTTVAPMISDDPDFIRLIAQEVRDRCDVYYLQQFDNTGEVLSPLLKSLSPPTRERMVELAKVAVDEGVGEVYIKTRKHGLERVD